MNGEQLELPLEGGDIMEMTSAITTALSAIKDGLSLYMEAPTIYFIGLALVGGAIGVGRKLIPMRRK